MIVEEFIDICNDLHNNINKMIIGDMEIDNGLNKTELSVSLDIERIIESDEIKTDDEQMISLYKEIGELVRLIKSSWQTLSHLESKMKKEMNNFPSKDNKLVNLSQFYTVQKNLLYSKYQKIIALTEKELNIEKTK